MSVLDERHLEAQKGRIAQLPSDGYEKDKQPQVWHYKVVSHGQLLIAIVVYKYSNPKIDAEKWETQKYMHQRSSN